MCGFVACLNIVEVPFLQVTKHWESARSPRKPKLLEKSQNENVALSLTGTDQWFCCLKKRGISEGPVVNLLYNFIACYFSMFTSTLEGSFPDGPCWKCCCDPNYKNIYCLHLSCFVCNINCTKLWLFFSCIFILLTHLWQSESQIEEFELKEK